MVPPFLVSRTAPIRVFLATAFLSTWLIGHTARASPDCAFALQQFNPRLHKQKYKVAIHATEGFETAFETYNATFAEYLTATAGRRFNRPIEFEVVPMTYGGLIEAIKNKQVDFMFTNPSTYSCVGVEKGARPVATIVQRLGVHGNLYELDTYAGVMFTLAENEEIKDVDDFKDKVIGAGGITVLNGAQSQFYEMLVAGMSYVMDPKQVVFTGDQVAVVDGVISGEFDVGFVRTDQLERHLDKTGKPINRNIFKVVHPKVHVQDDGSLFPFLHSTEVYPEYVFSSLEYTPDVVVSEVQNALLALRDHAKVGADFEGCDSSLIDCASVATRCDTTYEIAKLALAASRDGHLVGFRTPRSYFNVRSMQQAVGFMTTDEKGDWKCTKDETLFESLPCPDGHYKLNEAEFEASCPRKGLHCKAGYTCYCRPCIKSHEVEVFQYYSERNQTSSSMVLGCDKMALCGNIEQTKRITFRILDNLKRTISSVLVRIHVDDTKQEMFAQQTVGEPFTYEFSWTGKNTGIVLLEIEFDDEQIPESPLRFEVNERRCNVEFPGSRRIPDDVGDCVCSRGSLYIAGKCLSPSILTTGACMVALVGLVLAGNLALRYRTRQIDALWKIDIDELTFEDPAVVIGQGSFGVVIRAEYRSINVAIKRAVKPRNSSRFGSMTHGQSKVDSFMGVGSVENIPTHLNDDDDFDENPEDFADANASVLAKTGTSGGHLNFLREYRTQKINIMNPWKSSVSMSHAMLKATMLGGSFSMTTHKTLKQRLMPCLDPQRKRVEDFMKEMRVLSRLRHPCITTVFGAVIANPRDPMLVMEYLEYGSLAEGLLQNETIYLTGEIILQVSRDVVQGLRYLHSTKPAILHGDLKAKNILIDARFRAKLCDFGLSKKKRNSISGTPYWLPPEYLVGDSDYTTSCDMYSFGVCVFEMYSRKSPYLGENFEQVLRQVCDPRKKKRPQISRSTPPRMAELMRNCWNVNPLSRPDAKDLDRIMMDLQASDLEPLTGNEEHSRAKVRTGDMLYEIFPRHIADTLKAGKKPDAEHHDLCTIVFSDIVGFTTISREISPLKVSEMLDRLYLAFDCIAGKHNVFKVETIGDAYMGVTNLQGDQHHNHVKLIAEFAIDMVKEASKILVDEDYPERGCINIRVGFHSGPVVSNVIGSLNPRYGLFGDAVNTANRMESNSKANRILCSEYSYNLLKRQAPEMKVRRRGKIDVKGRGEMRVFWVGETAHNDFSQSQSHSYLDFLAESEGKRVGFADDAKSVESAPFPEQNPRDFLRTTSPAERAVKYIGNMLRPSPIKKSSSCPSPIKKSSSFDSTQNVSVLKKATTETGGTSDQTVHRSSRSEWTKRNSSPEYPKAINVKSKDDFTANETDLEASILKHQYPSESHKPTRFPDPAASLCTLVSSSEGENVVELFEANASSSEAAWLTSQADGEDNTSDFGLYDPVIVKQHNLRLEAIIVHFSPGGEVGVRLTGASAGTGMGESLTEFQGPPQCDMRVPRSVLSKRSLSRLQELSLRKFLAELTFRQELSRHQEGDRKG